MNYTSTYKGVTSRIYFDPDNKVLQDALLHQYVDGSLLQDSSNYIESLALSYGVEAKDISNPTPYLIQQIARYYTYMRIAMLRSQFSSGKEAIKDSFYLKYELYRDMLKQLEAGLEKITFTNGVQAKKRRFPMVVPISRN